ncbi:MAG: hypothetical protein JWQ97_958 [Phenylobacterium sp.]|nr:hypothetical protein [Phenylobacterium sp.]
MRTTPTTPRHTLTHREVRALRTRLAVSEHEVGEAHELIAELNLQLDCANAAAVRMARVGGQAASARRVA